MKIAERSLETRSFLVRRCEQRFNQSYKVSSGKWLFQIMDRAQPAGLFPLNRKMRRGENNRPGFRVTGPKVVDKILRVFRGSIEIQNKQLRLLVEHQMLRFA